MRPGARGVHTDIIAAMGLGVQWNGSGISKVLWRTVHCSRINASTGRINMFTVALAIGVAQCEIGFSIDCADTTEL